MLEEPTDEFCTEMSVSVSWLISCKWIWIALHLYVQYCNEWHSFFCRIRFIRMEFRAHSEHVQSNTYSNVCLVYFNKEINETDTSACRSHFRNGLKKYYRSDENFQSENGPPWLFILQAYFFSLFPTWSLF